MLWEKILLQWQPSFTWYEATRLDSVSLARKIVIISLCVWSQPWIFLSAKLRNNPKLASESLQWCLTFCDSMDCSPPSCSVHGILQARTLEWVAISFPSAWKWKVKAKSLSCVWLFATHGLQPTRLLRPWDFPDKSTGVGCHRLLRHSGYDPLSWKSWASPLIGMPQVEYIHPVSGCLFSTN